jgi:quinohemoprotein ethanol dehydrogenase
LVPDLRQLPRAIHNIFYEVVLRGADAANGMARWDDVLTQQDAEAIHAYLVDQAWQLQSSAAKSAVAAPAGAGVSP